MFSLRDIPVRGLQQGDMVVCRIAPPICVSVLGGWSLLSDMMGVISPVDSSRSSKGSIPPHNVTLDTIHTFVQNAAKMLQYCMNV